MTGDSKDILYITDETLAKLGISTTDIVNCIEKAITDQHENRLWTSPKASILPGDGRYIMSTLAASDSPGIVVVKSVIVSPRNPQRNLPGINGGIMLLDSETGELRAVMDANWVTAVRTSGLSAVVAKRLADPESNSIAFVGCGVQAKSHLDAFSELFPISEIRAFGRGSSNVNKLCSYAEQKGFQSNASSTPQEALEGADIVVSSITLSYDVDPFLDAAWMKPGAFAVMTDLALPWKSASMGKFGKVIIDDKVQEAAMEKSMVDSKLITGDMKDLIDGSVVVSYDKEEKTAFVFRGLALGDFAVASMAYARATAKE